MLKIKESDAVFSILKSSLVVVFISFLCSIAAHLCDKSFWAAFCLTTAIQYIVGYAIASYTYSAYKRSAYITELDKLEQLSTILNCAYCNKPNVVTFLPDQVPAITCEYCKNVSSVKLSFTVTRQTSTLPESLSEPLKNHNIKY